MGVYILVLKFLLAKSENIFLGQEWIVVTVYILKVFFLDTNQ
jgi:hypothetical protein